MYAPTDEYVPQCVPRAAARGALFTWGALSAIALALLSLVFAAPLFLAHGQTTLASAIYTTFSYLCHQIPERSFHLEGHPLGVCARCTGLYTGFAAGVLLFPVLRSLKRATSPARIWLGLACVPIAVDFALTYFGIWENTHLSRFTTGAILGAACALFIVPGIVDLVQIVRERSLRVPEKRGEPSLTVADSSKRAPTDYSAPYRRI